MEIYKILGGGSPSYLRNFFTLKDSKYSKYSFRYENILEIPCVNSTKYGINRFRYIAAKVWNSLHSECGSACDFTKFKDMIKNSWNVLCVGTLSLIWCAFS